VIGWGGLSIDPEEPEWGLEVCYALAPNAWGNGFATELVQFSLGVAFQMLSAPLVHAFAKPENLASIKVLQKSGFVLLRYESRLQRNHYAVASVA
jgi:RimJ/RimL family protein N-acetyltransferase